MSTHRQKLLELVRSRAANARVQVKLASGQSSDYYINCKDVTLHGPSLAVLGEAFAEELRALPQPPEQVAGVSVGGDPMVAAVLIAAQRAGWELEGLLVRKEAKSHGLSQGKAVDGAAPRGGVWLVEDVISTGGSLATAFANLKREGYRVDGILALVDREMGGRERLEKEFGVPVKALFAVRQILETPSKS